MAPSATSCRNGRAASFPAVGWSQDIKALSEQLQVRKPDKAQCQATEDLVNRMICRANSAYAAVLCHEHALHHLRKQQVTNDP
jgi:hypothetical protein